MKQTIKGLLVTAAAALALGAFAEPAEARNYPGFFGKGWTAADTNCFTNDWGAAVNSCSARKQWLLGQTIDAGFVYNTAVQVVGHVDCQTYGAHELTRYSTPVRGVSSGSAAATISMDPITILGGGYLHTQCWVDPGSKVLSIFQ